MLETVVVWDPLWALVQLSRIKARACSAERAAKQQFLVWRFTIFVAPPWLPTVVLAWSRVVKHEVS